MNREFEHGIATKPDSEMGRPPKLPDWSPKITEPIIEFKSNAELRECLKYWQNILYLNDWVISASLVDASELPDVQGDVTICRCHKSAVIRIVRLSEDMKGRIVKTYHEVALLHELMHCKTAYLMDETDTYEGRTVECENHTLTEMMARSLIMAKYGLTPEWFNNVKDD